MRHTHNSQKCLYTDSIPALKYSFERIRHRWSGESSTPEKPQTIVSITYGIIKPVSPREWINGISMGRVTPTNAMVIPVMSPTKNGSITATNMSGTLSMMSSLLIASTAWLSSKIPLKIKIDATMYIIFKFWGLLITFHILSLDRLFLNHTHPMDIKSEKIRPISLEIERYGNR